MMNIFHIWERRARYTMGVLAALLAVIALLFKAGWISTTPTYRDASWYSAREQAGFIVTREHADEAECRAAALQSGVTCRSGRSLALRRKTVAG
jgi:hypothetical protein